MTLSDPKPVRRIVDSDAFAEFHDENRVCIVCWNGPVEAHHLLHRSRGGDDVAANLIPLCQNCHRAYHGSPYREEWSGKRITGSDVRRIIGQRLGRQHRAYLYGRLGMRAGVAYLNREFGQ